MKLRQDISRRAGQRWHWLRIFPALLALWIVTGTLLSPSAQAAELSTDNPYRLKAAFVKAFTRYVTWPTNAFASAESPWRIAVLGDNPYGDLLEQTVRARKELGRSLEIVRVKRWQDLPDCQVVLVMLADPAERKAALASLRSRPVLTVGEAPDFLREGGMIRLSQRDRIQLHLDLNNFRASSLTPKAGLLEVATEVIGQPARERGGN